MDKYEGKGIIVIDERYDITGKFNCIVSGHDYDIGISIELKDKKDLDKLIDFYKTNSNGYLLCLNGPSSPEFNYQWFDEKQYKTLFDRVTSMLDDGVYYMGTTSLPWSINKSTMAACPFNL